MPINFTKYFLNFLHKVKGLHLQRHAPDFLELGGCICHPLSPLPGPGLKLRGGIFKEDGSYVAASGLITAGKVIVGAGYGPIPLPDKTLSGNSLYLGVCHYHYGHFLIETMSRLWRFDKHELAVYDHILLMPLNGHIPAFALDLFQHLNIKDKIFIVDEPLRLEFVHVPAPAIIYPSKVYRQIAAIQKLFTEWCSPQITDQALFLSRAALTPGHHRTLIGEDYLEKILSENGVRIFHPERHSIFEQVATFNKHRTIIGFAGSALHTLILIGGGKHIFAYSSRPVPGIFPLLDQALGHKTCYIHAQREPLAGQAQISTGFTPQIIDPRPILAALNKMGVIGTYDLGDYGSAESDATEVRRYNTALLLRHILEESQSKGDEACRIAIDKFKEIYVLDSKLLSRAQEESALLRRLFPMDQA